jgi:hypothetical protein
MSAPPEAAARAAAASSWDPSFVARSPLFWPLEGAASTLRRTCANGELAFPPPETIDRALGARAGVRFERQRPVTRRRRGPRDPSSMYDARIKAGCVPTRPGSWHDLMNALVWATFPRAKRALHERQHALVVPAAPGESARRPRELDTLALLDEGGAVVIGRLPLDDEEALVAALDDRTATVLVFGHAVYEGIVLGRPEPLMSVVCVEGDPTSTPEGLVARADDALARVVGDPARLREPRDLLRLRRVEPADRAGKEHAGGFA